ncbi:MAG: SBBP repeat-containing protein [Clostridiales bacterium]|nr:SBBP repeat-containing protein [Clostridiales bacterium]
MRRIVRKSIRSLFSLSIILSAILAFGGRLSAFALKNFVQGAGAWGKNTVYFVPNRGQFSDPVEFAVQDKNLIAFFSAEEVTFLLPGETHPWVVKMKFLNGHARTKPVPGGTPETIFSYFKGPEREWKAGIPVYGQIRYPNLWPGIDLVYSNSDLGLKSEFLISPGADPGDIRLAIEGADSVLVDKGGRLVISTPGRTVVDEAPTAYQKMGGRRVEVMASYRLEAHSSSDDHSSLDHAGQRERKAHAYSFSIGPYDRSQELILDPVVMVAGSYIGGPSFDYAHGIALDNAGHVYITGYTYSTSNFPLAAGPQLNHSGGDVDAYVARIDPSSSRLVYCGYIGGDDRDFAYDIAVDEAGNAYVAGYTASRENSFPVVKGPDLTANGLFDVFIAKINPAGTKLEYCGFIGGADNDYGRGVAVDQEGRACVAGYTLSNESSFPVKIGPFLNAKGKSEAFVARVSAGGEALEFCGFMGGTGEDYAYGIALDPEGGAYIAGSTSSTEISFPIIFGPDITFNGDTDAFVAKVAPSGKTIVYCGYIGGAGEDVATAITVDSSGCAYLTGFTASIQESFPIVYGPDSTYNGGFYDSFVAKVRPDGTTLIYCGYIGGSGYDVGNGISVDDWGCAYVTGFTSSGPDSFPVKEGPDLTFDGSFDAFIAKLASNGAKLDFCGYLGGSEADFGQDVAVEKAGSGVVYMTGSAYSADMAFPASLVPASSFRGKRDAFIVRYEETSITVTAPNIGEIWYSGLEKNITWRSVGKVGPVRIDFSPDDGTTWQAIAAETENDGLFSWVVPDISSTSCLVKISEADDGIPSDTSDGVFVISNAPVIVVTSPNGGEEWPVGSTQEITWLTGSTPVGEVRIDYSFDNGLNWIEVVSRTENDGIFEWEVPDTVSPECFVKISEADDGAPADRSDAPFSIVEAESGSHNSKRSKRLADEDRLLQIEKVNKSRKKNS